MRPVESSVAVPVEDSAPPERAPTPRIQFLMVFVVATAVSAVRSGDVSLWTDEAITISAATRTWDQLWELLGRIDAVHGLYYAFMKLWVEAFGTSELVLRLPSALAVGGTAVGLLALARRMTTPRTALTAALLCAVFPRMTWAGIEARPFVFSALVAVWATWAFAVAVDSGSAWRWVRYAVLAALGVVINIYLVLLVMGHGITTLVLRRHDRRSQLAYLGAAAGAAIMAFPMLLLVRSQQGQLGIGTDNSVGYILRRILVNQFFLGETPSDEAVAPWFDLTWQLAAVGAALLGAAIALAALLLPARRGDGKTEVLALALPWIVLPTLVVAAYAVVVAPIYQPRYFTFTVPAAALLLALGVRALPRRWYTVPGVALLAVAIAVVYVSQRLPYSKSGSDWGRAASVVAECAQPGDAVLFEPRSLDPLEHRTSRRIAMAYAAPFVGLVDLTESSTGAETGTLDGYSVDLSSIKDELHGYRTIWVIYGKNHSPEVISTDANILIGARYEATGRWVGPHTTIVEYRRSGTGAGILEEDGGCS